MWTSIGSPSKCVNRSDTEEKAVPLQQNNSFTRAGVGGSAVLGSFNCLKCLILSENPKECLTIYCTHAFSTLLEHQLHLTQTFRQMGSNRVKASPKTHSDLSFYFPGDVIFQAGPPDWKKREKKKECVNTSKWAPFPTWTSNANTRAAACWGSSRDPLKRSPQVIEKEQKEWKYFQPAEAFLWSACQVCFPLSSAK